jgi:hypothetical protein
MKIELGGEESDDSEREVRLSSDRAFENSSGVCGAMIA